MPVLSILIPARCEEFLARTIQDILSNIEADTEILVGLDGAWAEPVIVDNPRVKIFHVSESLGQRAMTNKLCRLSDAKYVMKVDAHCAFDKGFDRKMLEAIKDHDDWTMAPLMRNLHVFDWVCKNGHRRYQGPSGICEVCKEPTEKDVVWIPKTNPSSASFCFDSEPHFQYNGEYSKRKEARNGIVVGYKLSFNKPDLSTSVIGLLTDFASSHQLTSGSYSFWGGEDVSVNTVSLSSINGGGGVGTTEILGVGNESEVGGVATFPILTEVVEDGNSLTSSLGEGSNQPSIGNTMCELFLSEVGASAITSFINSTEPIPASARLFNSNVIKELNTILGGEFIYNEKTSSFHNGSVALKTVHDKGITESMSLQGSCFILTRDKYWELNICDEAFGSWGSQGIEVACKTWLSGGRVMINHNTFYAHLFRTQGGDFGFPYSNPEKNVQKAKKFARNLFFEDRLPNQVHPLSWLVEKFWPIPPTNKSKGWTQEALDAIKDHKPSVGAIYYTDGELDPTIMERCQKQLRESLKGEIVTASLKHKQKFGDYNIYFPHLKRGYLSMFKQILSALEHSTADIVFFCEHDVLYHPSHFTFIPDKKDVYYYNMNLWLVRSSDGFAVQYEQRSLSQLCAYRELLIEHYKKRIAKVESGDFHGYRYMGFEPGTNRRQDKIDDFDKGDFWSEQPNLDIRHGHNNTGARWSIDQFRNKPSYWRESTVKEIPGWKPEQVDFLGVV